MRAWPVVTLWLVVLPLLVLPRAYWDARQLQAAWLPVLGILAVGGLLIRERPALRWPALLGGYIALNTGLRGFSPPTSILALAGILAVGALLLVSTRLPAATMATALAVLGLIHLAAFVVQLAVGWHPSGSLFAGGWVTTAEVPEHIRYAGIMENRASAAYLLAVTAPWMVWWLIDSARTDRLSWGVALLLAMLVCSAAAFAVWRVLGGLLAITTGVPVLLLVADGPRSRRVAVSLAAMIGLVGLYWLTVDAPGWERGPIYLRALQDWWASPRLALFGHGLGSWALLGLGISANAWWVSVHNDWLQLGYEVGLIGVVLFAGAAVQTVRGFLRRGDALGSMGLVSAVAWLVASVVYFPLHVPALAGVGAALVVVAQHTEAG